uniref:VWFA domain-containing protein n=1 Tax=Parastrongyloides trichosuri TaxID=131310 RepID=A0A0N5A491_PARTI
MPSKKAFVIAGVAAIILLVGVALIIVAIVELSKKSDNSGIVFGNKNTTIAPLLPSTTSHSNPSNSVTLNIPTTTNTIQTTTPQFQTTTTENPSQICDIAFAIDASSDILLINDFNKQIAIVRDNVSALITNFQRVYITAYNNKVLEQFNFNSMNYRNDFQNNINTYTLDSGSSLSNVLLTIALTTPPSCGKLSTFVFISKYDPVEIQNSILVAETLKNRGSLNFIILGTDIKPENLSILSPSAILRFDFATCSPEEITNFYLLSKTCGISNSPSCTTTTLPPPTTIITTTQSPIIVTTSTQPPTTNCNVAFAVDLSADKLIPTYFNSEIHSIRDNVSTLFSDFSKVALFGYNAQMTGIQDFGTMFTRNDFMNIINTYQQSNGLNLYKALETLVNLAPYDCGYQVSFLFLSEKNSDIVDGRQLAAEIRNKGSLNIIILGTALKEEDLIPMNPSSIYVFDLAICDIDKLLAYIRSQLNCIPKNCLTTTTSPPCTETKVCNIVFGIDSSSDILTNEYFENQLQLIEDDISMRIDDFSRVAILDYNQNATLINGFGTLYSKQDFINAIKNIQQKPGSSLSSVLETISYLAIPDSYKLSTYILMSKNDPNEIAKSTSLSSKINVLGSLNFILLGTDVKKTNLLPLTYSNEIDYELATCDTQPVVEFFSNSLTCSNVCPPNPCNPNEQWCNIMFTIDASSDILQPNEYSQLMGYIKDNISSIIPNFDYVGLSSYNQYDVINNPIGTINNFNNYKNDIDAIKQAPGWNLNLMLQNLIDNVNIHSQTRLNTFVFVSKSDENEIKNSYYAVQRLKNLGTINFILVGTAIKEESIVALSPSNIYQIDFANCNVTELVQFFRNSLNCNMNCNTTPNPALTTPSIQTTTLCTLKKVCSPYVSIGIDTNSQGLDNVEYTFMKNVIQNNVSSVIPNYYTTSIDSFDPSQRRFSFGDIHSLGEFMLDINFLKQSSTSSLNLLLEKLDNQALPSNELLSSYIFISCVSTQDLQESINHAKSLKGKGTLNFIIVGTELNSQDLQPFEPSINIYVWDFTKCPIQKLLEFFVDSFACKFEC